MQNSNKSPGFTIVELLIVIVVIAVLAAIAIGAYNGIQDRAKASALASDITQWKKTSELHKITNNIECPANYVFVYGNSSLGTNDFCVMKYEAKNVGGVATSQPASAPWANISHTSAISVASSACSGCHLLTDLEWMTIAADVLSVKHNWSSGTVGTGYIYSGHNDNAPANSLAAGIDSDPYSGTGNSSTSGDNQKRVLYLKSGDAIWDVAGNMWEWTNATIGGNQQPGFSGETTFSFKQWNHGSLLMNGLPAMSRPSAIGASSYGTAQGIGHLYSNYGEATSRVYLRGGSWPDVASTGVLSLYLCCQPSYTYPTIGFRVAK
jgi:prepilin-type N-terminal cleavage/methylation domain-containing protein